MKDLFLQDNLLEKVKKKYIHSIIGRDIEIARMRRIISRTTRNNPCLVGDSGVGKTALLHGLIYNHLLNPLPDISHFLELNTDELANIIFSDRNQEDVQQEFLDFLAQQEQTVLVIDNAQILFSFDHLYIRRAVNLLKHIFNQHDNRVVLISDSSTYRSVIQKDPILQKYLSTIRVIEPSIKTSIKISQHKSNLLLENSKIEIEPDRVNDIVILAERYIHDQHLPQKAIDLIEEGISYVKEKNLKTVTIEIIKKIISERTGIPTQSISISDREKLVRLEETISSQVIGQKHAVDAVSRIIRRSRSGIQDPNRPLGTFLFLGASGIGKTELAKTLSKVVYDNDNALIRIDMSEFSEAHNVQRLLGAPPGYIGYEEGGQLTNPVWEQPYSLILLDEIEKAHPKVFDMFLQVFDDGRLTDGQGRTVDFKNTIIIATSNIGLDEIIDEYFSYDEQTRKDYIQENVLPLMLEYFRPEFVNRFDDMIIFKPFNIDDLIKIGSLQIELLASRLEDRKIKLSVSEPSLRSLAEISFNPKFGARPLKRIIREKIEDVIAQKLISGEIEEGYEIRF